jgi:hypothetical protein
MNSNELVSDFSLPDDVNYVRVFAGIAFGEEKTMRIQTGGISRALDSKTCRKW